MYGSPSPSASQLPTSGSFAPIEAMYAPERASTGASSMRVFHQLSAGKMPTGFASLDCDGAPALPASDAGVPGSAPGAEEGIPPSATGLAPGPVTLARSG